MSHLIGITGTIGSGKSAVGSILEQRSVPVIDTDKLVHQLFSEDKSVVNAIHERFGDSVMNSDGSINRAELGKIVFADDSARKALEGIVHPATILACRKRVKELSGHPIVAVLVPLLFEAGVQSEYDEIWTIIADRSVLKARLMQRDQLTDAEAEARLGAQLTQEDKASRSHRVVDNSGTLDETAKQIDLILTQLAALSSKKAN